MRNLNWPQISRASSALLANVVANSSTLGRTAAGDFAALKREAVSAYSAIARDVGDVGATFRSSPRYLRMATVGARIAARYRLMKALAEHLGPSTVDVAHEAGARELFELCVELGGGVLKVGQLLSARADLLPPAYIEALSTLQDQAPQIDFSEIEPILFEDLGLLADTFAEIDPSAIAAASLAQVHKARLLDGSDVVIKVQRPGVAELVNADLRALSFLASMFGDALPGLDAVAFAAEISRFVRAELDFEREAERLEEFAAIAAADPRWHVPAVVKTLATRRLIVMERIEGRPLLAYLADADTSEIARLIAVLVESLANQVLVDGVAHGDPHPGNLLVDESGRLVFVDFGCVLELPAAERRAYVALVMAIVAKNPAAIASALEAAGFSAAEPSALTELAAIFLEGFEPGMLAEMDPAEQIRRSMAMIRRAGHIAVPPSFVLIGRIFALVGGIVLSHGHAVDLAPLMLQTLERALTGARFA